MSIDIEAGEFNFGQQDGDAPNVGADFGRNMLIHLDVGVLSDSGPRAHNEDAAAIEIIDGNTVLLCVADGVGGHFGGAVASELATEELKKAVRQDAKRDLASVFRDIHRELRQRQSEDMQLRNMATTLTCVLVEGLKLIGAHCGDSRCIVARGEGVKKLTVEHTEAQRFLEAGKLTKEEFLNYPRKNILDSALGSDEEPRIDQFAFELLPGDWIVLTTDGVHELIRLRELRDLILHSLTSGELMRKIRDEVAKKRPADNYTAVCGHVALASA